MDLVGFGLFGSGFSPVPKTNAECSSRTHRREGCEGSLHGLTIFSLLKQQKGPRSDNSKSNKIFVGGIPHNCGETELREYFKKFGVVSCSGPEHGGAGREWWSRVSTEVRPGSCPQRLGLCLPQSGPEPRRGDVRFFQAHSRSPGRPPERPFRSAGGATV